jgi:signal transduction histidine kinase
MDTHAIASIPTRHWERDESFWTGMPAAVTELPTRRSKAVTDAILADRHRVVLELHDTAGQTLVAIGLLAGTLAETMEASGSDAAPVRRLAHLAARGRLEMDSAVGALSFRSEVEPGLGAALRRLGADVAADSGLQVRVDAREPEGRLDAALERALYRIAREAVTNAWRHSRCQAITVDFDVRGHDATLRVSDDGVGVSDGPGIGMASMHATAAAVGGRVEVRSGEASGTVVEVRVPGVGR